MRRKRLQHAADTLCHMFCGWRLINSYTDLEKRGTGTIIIDALTGRATHNETSLQGLAIAGELQHWLAADLLAHHIDPALLLEAVLHAQLSFGHVPRSERITRDQHFDPAGHHLHPERFIRCDISCVSRVATDECVYEGKYHDIEEWPSGFPSARPT